MQNGGPDQRCLSADPGRQGLKKVIHSLGCVRREE
jgi:hypothetical protein